MQKIKYALLGSLVTLVLIVACGGNNGDGGNDEPNEYSVGGSVTGLSGTLIVKNNGTDEKALTTNEPFTFPTKMSNDSTYLVTVYSEPLEQTCVVSNSSGVVNSANVDDIEINCLNKSWAHPSDTNDFFSPDVGDAAFPQVAMDISGNAIIVWSQGGRIFKSEFRNSTWNHPVSSDYISPTGTASKPSVAMNDFGYAIIVWQQSDGSNIQIFKSEYKDGIWVHPSSLTDNITPDGTDASYARVAIDNNGDAIIVWQQENTEDPIVTEVFMSGFRDSTWNHPEDLDDHINPDNPGMNCSSPKVTMDNLGNAIIVWENGQIYMSEYRNDAWIHPAIDNYINPLADQYAYHPQVAMDDNANAIIVWQQNYKILKSEYRNATWHNPASLDDRINPDGQDAWTPQVAMDNNENAIIVWQQMVESIWHIFKSEYRNDTWINPSDVTDNISPGGQNAVIPKVAMDNNDTALIVWEQNGISNPQIFKSEYRNSSWIYPSSLTDNISPGVTKAISAQLALSDMGNAIIVWTQDTDFYRQVFKSEYR